MQLELVDNNSDPVEIEDDDEDDQELSSEEDDVDLI